MTADCTIVQLTDTHIVRPGELLRGIVDTTENLHVVLDRIVSSGQRVDALLLSGDLTDTGDPAAYRRLRAAVERAALQLGAKVLYTMGNHDSRDEFHTELDVPFDAVHQLDGARVITVDSTFPGRHDGWLSDEQLDWLTFQLARPNDSGVTILAMHHPPLRSAVAPVDYLRLQQTDRLADVIAGSDVATIVCGHAHLTGSGTLSGVPVWIGPAMSYRIDPFAPLGKHRGFVGFGFSRIDVIDGSVVTTAVDATPAEPVYDTSVEMTMTTLRELARDS